MVSGVPKPEENKDSNGAAETKLFVARGIFDYIR
jgi:hypothetical protein